jgi:hypothetical protein
MPPLERFTAVVERPLFSPTRRMPAIPEPPPDATAGEAPAASTAGPSGPGEPDVRFFGTVQQGGKLAALVTIPSTNEVARLVPGNRVDPWEVLAVERNRIVLGAGEERRTLEIFGSGLRQPAAEAPEPGGTARSGRTGAGAEEPADAPNDTPVDESAEPDSMGDGEGQDVPVEELPPEEGDQTGQGEDLSLPPEPPPSPPRRR